MAIGVGRADEWIQQEDAEVAEKGMHVLFPKASKLTESIIGAAIEVHRDKGPILMRRAG